MKHIAFWILATAALIFFLWANGSMDYDDTDPPGGRSGLVLLTDHGTGCQYLKAPGYWNGALSPRLGADGKPICGRRP